MTQEGTAEGTEGLKLTLALQEVPVEMTLKDGTTQAFVLRELTGKGRDSYLSTMANKMKFGKDGTPSGIRSFEGLQASLLALCLFDEADELVPIRDIQEYPASAQKLLFDKAQEINGLGEEGEADAKNV